MKLTLSDIRGQVARLLRDNGINGSQFEPTKVTNAINMACDRAAVQTGCTYSETSVTPTDGKIAIPATTISMVRAFYSDGGTMKLLQKTSLQFEDDKDPSWRTKTGTPSYWMDFAGDTIRLNRIPATGSITIGYVERPAPMELETDTPDSRINEYYHQYLKYAAAAFLLNQAGSQEDIAKADKFIAQFNSLIGAGPAPVASTEVDR